MSELVTAAQMRAIEQEAIASGEVTGLQLMERAGQGVVDAIYEEWPELTEGAHRAVILCGPGNNGGDGFVIARLLAARGWSVEVFFYGEVSKLPPDARVNYDRWVEVGEVAPMEPTRAARGARPRILLDAMFGTGLSRPIPTDCARTFRAVEAREVPGSDHRWHSPFDRIAVDCPSGWDCDGGSYLLPSPPEDLSEDDFGAFLKGEVNPRVLPTDLCVTFHRAKLGHYLDEASRSRPVVVDIGLPEGPATAMPALYPDAPDPRTRLICPAPDDMSEVRVWLSGLYDFLSRPAHKYDRGHALILGGGPGHGGAARLAARAALRVGAGLVTLGVPGEAMAQNAAQLTAIMLREIGTPEALSDALADPRLGSVCLGPGLGVTQRTRDLVAAALVPDEGESRTVVLDADALTAFAQDPDALFAQCHARTVLTPHEGEFARLFPDLGEKVRRRDSAKPGLSKVEAVRTAARRAGATVLLKGAATVIASPDGLTTIQAALYDRRAAWLGTAGAGDVLAGLIAGLLAPPKATMTLHQRVECAAFLHNEAARSFGPGLIAEDLPEELPNVFRALGL